MSNNHAFIIWAGIAFFVCGILAIIGVHLISAPQHPPSREEKYGRIVLMLAFIVLVIFGWFLYRALTVS